MTHKKYTYQIPFITRFSISWDVVMWLVILGVLLKLGFMSNQEGLQMGFNFSEYLYLLVLEPILLIGLVVYSMRSNKQLTSPSTINFSKIIHPISSRYIALKHALFRTAITCLIFALATPVYGTKKVKSHVNTMELVIGLDISNSMNTRDLSPQETRLEISKHALHQLINGLSGERIGLVIFAGEAFVQLPLTADYHAAKLFIDELSTDMISRQGTSIPAVLETATAMFTKDDTGKMILLVTDGENHESNAASAIENMKSKQIELCVLGVGSREGGPIPVDVNRHEFGFKTDEQGKTILSKVNPTFIKSLAAQADGSAFLCNSAYPELSGILSAIRNIKHSRLEDLTFNVKDNRYQFPLFAAGIFFGLLFLIKLEPIKHRIENQ